MLEASGTRVEPAAAIVAGMPDPGGSATATHGNGGEAPRIGALADSGRTPVATRICALVVRRPRDSAAAVPRAAGPVDQAIVIGTTGGVGPRSAKDERAAAGQPAMGRGRRSVGTPATGRGPAASRPVDEDRPVTTARPSDPEASPGGDPVRAIGPRVSAIAPAADNHGSAARRHDRRSGRDRVGRRVADVRPDNRAHGRANRDRTSAALSRPRPTCSVRTRSSSPVVARSRRRSSPDVPLVCFSSSPSVARRSSGSSSTRRACGSPSSRSKAER